MTWQEELVARLRLDRALTDVKPYGSSSSGEGVDGWSDLDVVVGSTAHREVEEVLGAPLWAWQEALEDDQRLRLVLRDGRRVDLRVEGVPMRLPRPPVDVAVRFDAALAACRIGRGAELIGLHLLLGVLREALLQGMLLADREAGTTHHRAGTAEDRRVAEVGALIARPLHVEAAAEAYGLFGRWRAELDASYAADPSGLEAVLARGRGR